MDHLESVTVEELRESLDRVDDKKPAIRLVAAIAVKHGVTQSELARWFDVERKTIYNWLQRLESPPYDEAVRDNKRPGRPRKLSQSQLDQIAEAVARTDDPWTPDRVQRYILEEFDVEYSLPSCRRLLQEID